MGYVMLMILWILICFPIVGYSLRQVREGNFVVFFNDKDLRVKAYYLLEEQVYYVYRYYYNIKDLIVRAEKWKKNKRISYFIYQYDNTNKIKAKHFFKHEKVQYIVTYNKEGQEIKKEILNRKNSLPK